MTMPTTDHPNLFPSLDSIEPILWPAAAVLVFVVTAVLVDLLVLIAARWRLVDMPNRRSAHALPTARGGGLAIVLTATLAALALVLRWPPATHLILVGVCLPCLAVAVLGIIDDIQPLNASLRLLIHVAVATTITAVLGPIREITIPGFPPLALGAAGWPLTILWIVGMTNAFNFMDGADGMAGLGAVVGAAALALVGWQLRMHLPMMLAAFVAAAAGGFLVFNWQPARVFMGDVGSGFLGTILAAIPLMYPEPLQAAVIVPAVCGLWPFIFDPLVSVLRRLWDGANPLQPHREFFFHRLIRSGVSHGTAAALYGGLAAVGGLVAWGLVNPAVPVGVQAAGPLAIAGLATLLAWGVERRCARVGLDRPFAPAAVPADPEAAGLYAGFLKRVFDVCAAAVLVAVLLPVMAATWLAVRLALGRPVLHADVRAGRGGRPFRVLKFRSMREATDAAGVPLPDAERLDGFGRLLRRTSLDELPQLFNVLRGDMSLVGPRPLPIRYVERYSPRQALRLRVRPGLTGWAQIHGRNAVDWPRRLEFDARYVEILGTWWAPAADLWIILVTLFQIVVQAVTGRGVAAPGSATMEEFLPCP